MKALKLRPDWWLSNKALRACSPAARGFAVDLMCLSWPSGRLVVNGRPVDDTQLARMVGEPIRAIRGWLIELGDAGAYAVDDEGLYFPEMVGKPVRRSKTITVRRPNKFQAPTELVISGDEPQPSREDLQDRLDKTITELVIDETAFMKDATPAPARKALPWYKSPAGWVRMGQQQAMSMQTDEAFEDFQVRLAARIPPGIHLSELTERQQKMVEFARPKNAMWDEKS